MSELLKDIQNLGKNNKEKQQLVDELVSLVENAGYSILEVDSARPWGGFIRIDNAQADRFVEEFFSGLTPSGARLGIEGAELSPKFLIFSPHQRLSWQYHHKRAERWKFLTPGHYSRSLDDQEGEQQQAVAGQEVQFNKGERHRGGAFDSYTIAAEIWQHIDPGQLSDESDIVRLSDDYNR
ncbi:MAG: phosphoheptose isomerase [Candidatus Saccharibacteria bacterium]